MFDTKFIDPSPMLAFGKVGSHLVQARCVSSMIAPLYSTANAPGATASFWNDIQDRMP
jgi:hypothetical protein